MDAVNRFSIEDFLAYLFPGAIGALGLFLLLLLTPLKTTLTYLSIDVTLGTLLLIWSYVFGLILSGMTLPLLRLTDKIRKLKDPKFEDPRISLRFLEKAPEKVLREVIQKIHETYSAILETDNSNDFECSKAHFYLCGSLVETWMPNASQLIRRQISLKRVRENMMPVILIWGVVGVAWSIHAIRSELVGWGITLLALSLIATFIILLVLSTSLVGNNKREVREICVALLVGVTQELFPGPGRRAMLKAFGHNAQHQRLNASDRLVARLTVHEDFRQVDNSMPD